MSQPKQNIRSKEELLKDLKDNKEFQAKVAFAREKFYPALIEASTSVNDAQMLLSGFNTTIMQEFLALMKMKRLGELDLQSKLAKDNPKLKESLALLALFDDMTIFDAKDHIEGMKGEIDLWINDDLRERPLGELKTKWVDQL